MDTTDPDITFDEQGICNHCLRFDQLQSARLSNNSIDVFNSILRKIKKDGEKKDYDCLIGVSGGVDSSYLLYLAVKHGLRPLAVHVDNGWNSELSTSNINQLVKTLNVDIITEILDWNEFRELQLSFLKSGTPDGEIPSDHAIDATLWKYAHKLKIKYILSGMNFQSESISVPKWAYGHSDYKYIRSVHYTFSNKKLKHFPYYTLTYLAYLNFIRGKRIISLLNYTNYNKEKAITELENKLGWRRYEGKHYESVYTRFYQGYILPNKFQIDKRKGHLSDLINARQINRENAENILKEPPLSDEQLQIDKPYVLKKLGLSNGEFHELMNKENRLFDEFQNNYKLVQLARNTVNLLRKLHLYPK